MQMSRFWSGGVQAVALLSMMVVAVPARAGLSDIAGGALKKAGENISSTVAASKLPGGVSSRLKSIHQEIDKAEKALEKGSGTGVDRASRAEQSLQRAKSLKTEIEKNYAGQYSENQPDVAAAFGRLARMEESVKSAAQSAASDETAQRKAKEAEEAAVAKAEADKEAARKTQAEGSAASRSQAEDECENWRRRMQVYTEGDKAMYGCASASDDAMPACKATYDEAVAMMNEFKQTSLVADACGALRPVVSDLNRYMENFRVAYERYDRAQASAKANLGEIVFSKSPIDPRNPGKLTRQFDAGEYIYALIKTTKSWSAIYKNEQNANVMVDVKLDGKKIHAQFVHLKTPELVKQDYIVFDIAPDPGKMTAYSNPSVEYGKSTATMRQGPSELTYHLGQLTPGKHSVQLEVQYFGTSWAAGQFAVEGKDFGKYAELHTKIADSVAQSVTLPQAGMVDKSMTAEMKSLLENAGWSKIHRINIVDKDWWIDRMSGGDSPVKSRHIAAAALAEGGGGEYYYKVCTFHQDKLITGGFGKLYLSHQGDKVPIPKKNIDK